MKAKRVVFIAVGCFLAWAAVTGSAFAADPTDLPIVGGGLAIPLDPTAPNFATITLNGSAQTSNVALSSFQVNDARGTGAGWNVTVQASQFAEHNGSIYVPLGKSLPAGSLSMSVPAVTANGTSSASPSITTGPYSVDGGSAVKILSAAVDTGMGLYDVGATTLTVSVGANAYARTYRSDLTVSVASGP